MRIKKLLILSENVEKCMYEVLHNCNEKDRRDLYLPFSFYSLGGNIARLQFAANASETNQYLLDALQACVVIQYYSNLIGKCNIANVDSVLRAVKKLKPALIKEMKSTKRISKNEVRVQASWKTPLRDIVKEQLGKFDTYSLITEGCSNEIFAKEASEIVNQIIPNANANYVTRVIANVMEKSYRIHFDKDKFLPFAEKICEVLDETVAYMNRQGKFTVYYRVVFQNSSYDYTYSYDGNDICVGDYVLVPVGAEKIKTPARLSSVCTVFRKNGVVPDSYTNFKSIIRRISEDEYEDSTFIDDYLWE